MSLSPVMAASHAGLQGLTGLTRKQERKSGYKHKLSKIGSPGAPVPTSYEQEGVASQYLISRGYDNRQLQFQRSRIFGPMNDLPSPIVNGMILKISIAQATRLRSDKLNF